ncbi:MAG TPA: hypothetical protein VNB54_04760 [Alphaproteobacteria bacterium]|nr:hypothetical protein [Alphaproteobacteria bacterium]
MLINSGQMGYALASALAVYYVIAWLLVGRTRSMRSVMVHYTAPDNLSPAAMRFIYTMGADGRTYTAILARLAARGLLEIVPQKNGVILKRSEPDHRAARDLPAEEKKVFKDLFEWDEQVPLRRPDLRTMEKLHQMLEEQLGKKFFTRHIAWVVVGLAISGVAAAWLSAITLFGKDPADAWMMCAFTGLTVAMYGAFGYQMWDSNRLAIRLALRGMYRRRTLPLLLAFVLVYPALWLLIWHAAPTFAGFTEAIILMNTFLPSCLRNYTAEGRRVRDEIEGFRRFLAGTEQDRLQRMDPIGKPPRMDLEFVPYAVALDLRESWGDELGIRAMVETEL